MRQPAMDKIKNERAKMIENEGRCPGCGTPSRYVADRDLFIHEGESSNRRCRRLIHAGRDLFRTSHARTREGGRGSRR